MAKKSLGTTGQGVEIKGLEAVFKKMDKYENTVNKRIDIEAKKLVVNIVADGIRKARVDTGFLWSNIRVAIATNSYKAITHANYSIYVDARFPFFAKQAKKKIDKFIPKIKSIIAGI